MYGRAYLDWCEWVAAGKPSKSVGWYVETNFAPIFEAWVAEREKRLASIGSKSKAGQWYGAAVK